MITPGWSALPCSWK